MYGHSSGVEATLAKLRVNGNCKRVWVFANSFQSVSDCYHKYFAEFLSRKPVPEAYGMDRTLKTWNRARHSIPPDEGKTIS